MDNVHRHSAALSDTNSWRAAKRAGVQLKVGAQRKCECGDCPTCKARDSKSRQRAAKRAAAQQPNKKRGAPSAAASRSKKRRSS
ncbi:hypothetical protein CHLRE_08g358326v5 [Chlamydomonas reinhardtii]|uniref:Uncharacterized protein n=1 Tax=Chlamydomonas reinhardtii TaxID=3055 RepID=A0A2K3DG54_CHLRE|nr:uncharacterized protein CHLRE_08g358326v5 [Chlamydomonas reinhardtii]PNW79508.1 hypothetical protein CHLRE_08g358326v5 [Chlamydomonas reinhardtii]